jgi:hypothetical protein
VENHLWENVAFTNSPPSFVLSERNTIQVSRFYFFCLLISQGISEWIFRPMLNLARRAAEKVAQRFCHSERSEESLFLFIGLTPGEIPCSAQNDKIIGFFRSQPNHEPLAHLEIRINGPR